MNESIRQWQASERLVALARRLDRDPGLLAPGRCLLRAGVLAKVRAHPLRPCAR